ncbi:unnamed protein product [Staurois parvus]|uniref:Uncharacterized protein n=1 Tax=Staurois parvus TaxID=386267 RepID=A0ABN9GDH7_9NEOB|nr:unnamed protein product [Staurois parvus]
MCRECAPCTLPAHMCSTHGKVLVRSFNWDLSRSCDRRDNASWSHAP